MIINQFFLLEHNFMTFLQHSKNFQLEYDFYIRLRIDSVIETLDIDSITNNSIIIPTFMERDLFFSNKHISINDQFCITRDKLLFEKYCSLYSNLELTVKEIIKNQDFFEFSGVSMKEVYHRCLIFSETYWVFIY